MTQDENISEDQGKEQPSGENGGPDYREQWLRALADYQNLQKEVEKKRTDWISLSKAHILEDVIPVYAHFKKAFALPQGNGTKEQENWTKGIEYIMKQLGDVLKKHGVEEMKTVGEAFDPSLHEALGEEASEQPEGTIIKEIDGGYMLNGKVLRTAKVILAKHN